MVDDDKRNHLELLDRAHFFHPSTHMGNHASGRTPSRIMQTGSGVYVVDQRGNRSIDAFAGLYCVNVGYGRTEIADAIAAQARELAYYHSYVGHSSEPAILLSKKIIDRAPEGMSRIYYGLSGSDANETNIKLVWYYNNTLGRPNKKKIISRQRAYHGSGVMTGSLTGLGLFHAAFDLPREPIRHTHCAHYWKYASPGMTEEQFALWCADELDRLIQAEGPDTVAAFIAEPVMGTGGLIPPPKGYWPAIQRVLAKHDVLLIADEVITAFGRIGEWFGSTLYDIRPDLITIGKGVTSAYLPLSGTLVNERFWRVLEQGSDKLGPIGHGWTYSAHPVCAAAALANIAILERENILDNVRDVGAYFQRRLRDTFDDHPMVGECRGVGLLAALEFVADKATRQAFDPSLKIGPSVAAACLEQGLIARAMPHGDILGFAPPLIITRYEIDIVVECTKKAVEKVWATVRH